MFQTFAVVLSGILAFCSNEAIAQTKTLRIEESTYFQQHVAIVDAKVRSLSPTTYVRQLNLRDFAGQEPLPARLGFKTDGFADDGTGNDVVAGDGIYTSKDSYPHTSDVPYTGMEPRSAIAGPVTDYGFTHDQELSKMASGPGIKVKMKRCACPQECTCLACQWGWTNWCLLVEEVEIEIGW